MRNTPRARRPFTALAAFAAGVDTRNASKEGARSDYCHDSRARPAPACRADGAGGQRGVQRDGGGGVRRATRLNSLFATD
jgi:hypothetical protein